MTQNHRKDHSNLQIPQLSPVATFLINYLDLPEATGDPAARWEAFQVKHLNNTSLLAIELKSRQVGWSWLAAAESVAIGAMEKRATSIFVSINQDEAGEKVRYAKQIIESLDPDVRPKLITDNRFELEFENGSRMISHPCRPVRGKAKARVYLDEFAHYPNDREIYQSALPVISKGGMIRIGSSPLGAHGLFWEIFTQSMRPFPGYMRNAIPWWAVKAMCKDTCLAVILAPTMPTEERVYAFGTPRLIEIFENMLLPDFQQEYEVCWVDESVAWIDWDLIKRNQVADQQGHLLHFRAKSIEEAFQAIDDLAQACRDARVELTFCGGMDIGRTHDTTEIILLGKNMTGTLPYRLGITLDRIEFDDQEAVVSYMLNTLPITLLLIDKTGIGMQLAENMNKLHGDKAQGVYFDSTLKNLWAVEAKLRFQRGEVPIPLDRDLAYQIHSIKRMISSSKNSVYDTSANEKHHADQFWALALAIWAAKGDTLQALEVSSSPLSNYRG